MCIALPGKVLRVLGKHASVDFGGNTIEALIGPLPVKQGDSVLVHAGCVIQILSEFDSQALLELLDELENPPC